MSDPAAFAARVRAALAPVLVGQDAALELLLAAWLARGHVLLEGPPGVAKTLLARAFSAALGLPWGRIQFTPDLMPADVTGGAVFNFQDGSFRLQRGPVFTSVLLADEINRAPPRTQAALLEAMQERQVTLDGQSHPLDAEFFVLATQNPADHEGTYPLPEAQLDRFLLRVQMGHPDEDAEVEVYRRALAGALPAADAPLPIAPVATRAEIAAVRAAAATVHVAPALLGYTSAVLRRTRSSPALAWGGSPRAGIAWLLVARARAALDGRGFVLPDDLKALALPVLGHRLLPTPEAELDGFDVPRILDALLADVPVPR